MQTIPKRSHVRSTKGIQGRLLRVQRSAYYFQAGQARVAKGRRGKLNQPATPQSILTRTVRQVLVKVLACGVCHSDSVVQQQLFGNSLPMVPGHEIVGEVVAVPDTEKTWKKGERVGGAWHGGHDGTFSQVSLL